MSPRKRCRNFTTEEIDLLLHLLTDSRIKVIESKSIESTALALKNRAWDDVTSDFHSSGGGSDRDKASLKSCWKRLKEHAKKQRLQEEILPGDMTFKAKKVCDRLSVSVVSPDEEVAEEPSADFMIMLKEPPALYSPPKPAIASVTSDVKEDEARCVDAPLVVKSRASTPEYEEMDAASVAEDRSRGMSLYRRELLAMAREKHEATMVNLCLKRRLLEAQLKQLESA